MSRHLPRPLVELACRSGQRIGIVVILVLVVLMLSGCMVRDAYRQIAQLDTACVIRGTVAGDQDQAGPYIVAVFDQALRSGNGVMVPVDFFVMEDAGEWVFALEPGRYHLIGFRNLAGNLEYHADDPLTEYQDGSPLDCGSGEMTGRIELVIADQSRPGSPVAIRLSRDRPGFLADRARAIASLGQATAYGEVTTLDHARFSMETARDSLWRPVDFMLAGHAGIYFLEAYDPARIPVLFVHGINGSPRVFGDVIANMDRTRFQPWLYYYPSGLGLNENSDYLTQIMLELEVRHGVDRMHVIAHSMGGLIARAFLQRRAERGAPASVPVFIPISAPWGGHAAAGRAVDSSPLVMPVWNDLAPQSDFLASLFSGADHHSSRNLPDETATHLLFSYQGGDSLNWGTTDGVISLASLLPMQAQSEATSVFGFNESHIGILSDPAAIHRIHALLKNASE